MNKAADAQKYFFHLPNFFELISLAAPLSAFSDGLFIRAKSFQYFQLRNNKSIKLIFINQNKINKLLPIQTAFQGRVRFTNSIIKG
ncbi:hypothetical protein [Neisseria weaveri]|uniref:hypothetical protein n=1 Tax=Neisseria weaveri TaxID=28091 RepID=UPI000D311F8D|nr:hypothetical protein [Neisseria weaveri]